VKLLSLWGPVVLHMAVIFAGSSTSDTDLLPGRFVDKIAHMAIYALLGALVTRALSGGRLSAATWRHVVFAVLLSTLYGISDEWHQSFVPERTPDVMDLVADAIGAFAGALFVLVIGRLSVGRSTTLKAER
jgi:VanZ family protein